MIGFAGGAAVLCALLLARMPSQPPSGADPSTRTGPSALGTNQGSSPAKPPAVTSASPVSAAPLALNVVTPEGVSTDPPSSAPAAPLSSKASAATAPEFTDLPPETVMENVRGVLRLYRSQFGGNPVGTNPEITRALNGGNARQAVFFNPAEDGVRINVKGEMIDPWGTPFFFHQLSGAEMEIHSAGPDRILWTADDLVAK